MKVGLVLDDSLDRPDGVQQYITTLGDWLQSKDHDVMYLCGETKRTDKNVRSLSRNINVRFNKNRMSLPLPIPKSRIAQVLINEKFDVLHVQLPCTPWLAGQVVRLARPGTAIIGTFHIAPYSPLVSKATRLLGLALRPVMKRFDKVISVSEPAQHFAKLTLKSDSQVIPNLVNLTEMKSGRPLYHQRTPTIVYLGRLVERKGPQYLLKAVDHLVRMYGTECHVLMCGIGPMEKTLKQYVSKHGLEKYVTFTGFIAPEEKANYLASADIAVFPSTGGESFGIVLIEAMAAGAGTVLAGDNPGYRSVMAEVPETLFEPSEPKKLARKLDALIEDTYKREQIGKKQAEYVRKYDVEVVGPQLVQVYKEAIAKQQIKQHNTNK